MAAASLRGTDVWGSEAWRSWLLARSGFVLSAEILWPGAFGAFEALFAFGLFGESPFAFGDGVARLCRFARAFFVSAESVLGFGLSAALLDTGLSAVSGGSPPVF